MKQIENIFSNSPTEKITCPNPNCKIIIDTREKQSLIAANLIEQKALTEFEKLEIGDYLVGNTIIERKTFSDFVGSMLDKRLTSQLIEMQKYENRILILENFGYNYSKFNVHENAIRGMILSTIQNFKTPIVYTADEKDTAKFLISIAKKFEKNKQEFSIRQNKTPKNLEEQKQFILEGFPKIGPTAAKKMLNKFGNLRKTFESLPEELKKIGLNEKQISEFLKVLND